MEEIFKYESIIYSSEVGKGGAYVLFPYNIKALFNKGRLKVNVKFDGVDYTGSVVNMGIKDESGNVCYIIGIKKDIRKQISKDIGDTVTVQVEPII
ncbi:DUF1905 domain-containing protein [Mycoplasma sp. P36-A1]|uniref:DUF1905 domain-containing protein n=1 Tax=Mycoplasma sp. P36-A1 TaxID=3252900 RepID=UPI003C2B1556